MPVLLRRPSLVVGNDVVERLHRAGTVGMSRTEEGHPRGDGHQPQHPRRAGDGELRRPPHTGTESGHDRPVGPGRVQDVGRRGHDLIVAVGGPVGGAVDRPFPRPSKVTTRKWRAR